MKQSILVLILVLLCLTLFFFRLGARPLWDTDEGMHASTSKDMVLSGDWITPTFNGESFYDKPILYNWLAALAFMVFGFTEFAARLPAAVLGLGCVMVTYFLGRRMFGSMVGFFGGVILATSPEFIILSRVVVHDISLVFFVTLALFFFYLGLTSENHRKAYFFLFYASSGFAVLAKGPIGVILPTLIIGLFLFLKGKLRFLKEMQVGWGVLIFLMVAAPWYVLISLKNSDYAGYFFVKQNLMNFLSSEEARHPRPFYYYFPILLGGFFPWSFFLPLTLIRALWGRIREVDERTLFLVVWCGVILLFFSTARSKLSPYILPIFPPAAVLVGGLWSDLICAPTATLRKGFLYSYIPIVIILSAGLVYILTNPLVHLEVKYGIDLMRINYLVFLMVGIVTFSFLMFFRGHYKLFFSANAGLIVSGILLFIVLLVPLINPYRSTKGLAFKLDSIVLPGEKLVVYREIRDSALFYTDRKMLVLRNPKQLIDFFSSNKRAFCIIRKDHFEELKNDELKRNAYVIDKQGRDLIISNDRLP